MKTSLRWLVPGGTAAVIAGLLVAPGAAADLPAKSPEEVLVMASEAEVDSFSGTIRATLNLGIPTGLLTGLDGDAGSGPGAMAGTGLGDDERVVRVWKDGETLLRASAATSMGEQTLIRNGDDLWYYDSDAATLTTGEVPAEWDSQTSASDSRAWADVPEPAVLAEQLIDAVEPTTEVSAGEPTVVAGREAYEVVLTPQQQGTLVGSAALAVDAQTGAVLRVQVTATGASDPAVDVGFTEFDPTAPAAEVFALTTPPGASVEQFDPDTRDKADYGPTERESGAPEPTTVGTGWTTVVVLPAGEQKMAAEDVLPAELLQPVDGGAVLSTALVSVMLADDGRVLVGAVTPEVLAAAAA